ncbi:MAG: GNAT family N-acetyltransferase [Bacteroidaceae bacterium]|nr:GNAT family N-acetyltransferase [Prevotellaceae bacterium]MDY2848980.1 GNAT family N-acetyltransferase [Bacteroidaceae bacterium]
MKLNITRITTASQRLCMEINSLQADLTDHPRVLELQTLNTLLACGDTHLFLAYTPDTDTPVGMFTLAVTHLTTGNNVWLEDVVVARHSQGQGYGRAIVRHAIEQARQICPGGKLMLTSRPTRLAANRLYSELFEQKETNVYFMRL